MTDLIIDRYKPFMAYGQSKTANILMAREIENRYTQFVMIFSEQHWVSRSPVNWQLLNSSRYGKQGLHGWAVHPGMIATELGRYLTLQNFIDL